MVLGAYTVSFIFVVLRLYTRLFLTKSARWDDWTILLALVLSFLSGLQDSFASMCKRMLVPLSVPDLIFQKFIMDLDGSNTISTITRSKNTRNTLLENGFKLSLL